MPRSKKLDNISRTLILRSARRLILRKRLKLSLRPLRKSLRSLKRISRLMRLNLRTPRLTVRSQSSKRRLRLPRRSQKLLRLQLRPLRRLLPLSLMSSPISPAASLLRTRKRPSRPLRRRLRALPRSVLLPSPSSHWSRKKSRPLLPAVKVQLVLLPLLLPLPHPAQPQLATQVSLLELPSLVTSEEDPPPQPPLLPPTSQPKSLRSKRLLPS